MAQTGGPRHDVPVGPGHQRQGAAHPGTREIAQPFSSCGRREVVNTETVGGNSAGGALDPLRAYDRTRVQAPSDAAFAWLLSKPYRHIQRKLFVTL